MPSYQKSSLAFSSTYGYICEYQDSYIKLIYLRSRFYSPYLNRFIQPDTIVPDPRIPADWNRYIYTRDNPVNFTDPSGFITEKQGNRADVIRANLYNTYNVVIEKDWGLLSDLWIASGHLNVTPLSDCWQNGTWDIVELETIRDGIKDLAHAMGSAKKFEKFIGPVTVSKSKINLLGYPCGRGCTPPWNRNIDFLDLGNPPTTVDISNSNNIDKWTVVHEFGHAWDRNHGWSMSKFLVAFTHGSVGDRPSNCGEENALPGCNAAGYFYSGQPPAGSDNGFNPLEDFAESVASFVYPETAQSRVQQYSDPNNKYYRYLYYSDYTQTSRWMFINGLINLGTYP
ncbi:MAG: hypothetical protein NTW32_27265 [Chloroflexi bacterium]|nr:hypothetical protein [Chloroflexota bacterium]